MKVAVTGASGLLGGNLAILLAEAGHEVHCTRRPTSRVDHLDGHGLVWVEGDVEDAASLWRAFEGARWAFHCAAQVSILGAVTPALLRANVEGTRNVLEAVPEGARLVHCSSAVGVGLSEDGAPVDETAAWNFDKYGLADGYCRTKTMAEALVKLAATQGRDAVIVNPTYMLGPYDSKPSSGRMILEAARGRAVGYPLGGVNDFVDVRDVARGMIAAAEHGRAGERYILGGHPMSYREAFALMARRAGRGGPWLPLPRPVGALGGLAGDLVERLTGREGQVNSNSVRWGYTDRYKLRWDKARGELGYRVGPLERAIDDALAWFEERGMWVRGKPAR